MRPHRGGSGHPPNSGRQRSPERSSSSKLRAKFERPGHAQSRCDSTKTTPASGTTRPQVLGQMRCPAISTSSPASLSRNSSTEPSVKLIRKTSMGSNPLPRAAEVNSPMPLIRSCQQVSTGSASPLFALPLPSHPRGEVHRGSPPRRSHPLRRRRRVAGWCTPAREMPAAVQGRDAPRSRLLPSRQRAPNRTRRGRALIGPRGNHPLRPADSPAATAAGPGHPRPREGRGTRFRAWHRNQPDSCGPPMMKAKFSPGPHQRSVSRRTISR